MNQVLVDVYAVVSTPVIIALCWHVFDLRRRMRWQEEMPTTRKPAKGRRK